MSVAMAIDYKLRSLNKLATARVETKNNEITFWEVDGVSLPDQPTLDSWVSDWETKGKFESGFNVDLLTKRIGDVIDDAREIALMPYLGGIQSSAKAKNWAKLKALINGLGQAQIATANEVTAIKGVISEQGIDIDNY